MFKKYPCTMQHDQSDCAAAVVSTVLLSYKKELSIMKIRETIGTDMYGTTVSGIVTGLEKLHFTVKAVRVGIEELSPKLTFPAILQVKNGLGQNHFIVLHRVTKSSVFYVADPAKGNEKLTHDELDKIYQGISLFMVPNSDFEKGTLKGKALWNFMTSNNAATWSYIKTTAKMAWAGVKMFWMLPTWAKLVGVAAGAAFIYAIGTWSLFG